MTKPNNNNNNNNNKPVDSSTGLFINEHIASVMGIDYKEEIIEREMWDHYSELPNPMWYQHKNDIKTKDE